jgi:hypothetical protein
MAFMISALGSTTACAAVAEGEDFEAEVPGDQASSEELDEGSPDDPGLLEAAATDQAEVAGDLAPQSAAQCEGGANGFRDIPDTLRGTTVYTRALGGGTRTILYHGTVGGVQRGWAMIDGNTIAGDLVWMDWTQNNGASWIQCGPFGVTAGGQTKTSAAQRTSSSTSWRFRACGRAVGFGSVCGPWW